VQIQNQVWQLVSLIWTLKLVLKFAFLLLDFFAVKLRRTVQTPCQFEVFTIGTRSRNMPALLFTSRSIITAYAMPLKISVVQGYFNGSTMTVKNLRFIKETDYMSIKAAVSKPRYNVPT